mgnify:CR=1 FL=1
MAYTDSDDKVEIKVTNPQTNKTYYEQDIVKIIRQLPLVYIKSPNEDFPKYIDFLNNCISWSDNFESQTYGIFLLAYLNMVVFHQIIY